MKIGIISDIHANPAPLRDALALFRANEVEMVLCAGDIAGYGPEVAESVALLLASRCQAILGNHDLRFLAGLAGQDEQGLAGFFRKLPLARKFTVAGKRLYLVHGCPHHPLGQGIRLLDQDGKILLNRKDQWARSLASFEFELLVVGHTHQVFAEKIAGTLVINPGSTAYNHTCAILRLPEMGLEILPLMARNPVMSWHWGMERQGKGPA